MTQLIEDVKPRGIASAYVVAPFDQAKTALEAQGYRVISLEENARLRMQEGKDADVFQNGNWVREGFLFVPGKGKYLTKASPIMDSSVEATRAHRDEKEFYLTDEQVEKGLANSVKLKDRDFSIPTERFGEDEVIVYAFGNSAEAYGNFLKEAGINELPVVMVDNIRDKPFVRPTWFYGLDGSRGLGSGHLSYGGRVRGVREMGK